jgi:hypothetical protein
VRWRSAGGTGAVVAESVDVYIVSERNQEDPAGVDAAVAVVVGWILVFLMRVVDAGVDVDVQEATKDGAIAPSKKTTATGSRRS